MQSWRSADRDSNCDVAGFAGTLTAIHLARKSAGTVRVALIEKRKQFGRGVAYATEDPSHLLNVPAGKMGSSTVG
jgi:uncharacterized NAD(P)/FAD-binding protein YdhS